MADVASVVLVQSFTYRDAPEEWSNRYHLDSAAPTDATELQAVAEGIWDVLAPVLPPGTTLVRAYGYASDTAHASTVVDWTASPLSPLPGTQTASTQLASGDVAMTVRWATGRINSLGKPIYLRKYLHGCVRDADDPDGVVAGVLTALQAFGDGLLAEIASTGKFMAGPDGVVPLSAHASPWLTTRTLKRRGRRPPS